MKGHRLLRSVLMRTNWKAACVLTAMLAGAAGCGGNTEVVLLIRVGGDGSSFIHGGSLQLLLGSTPAFFLSFEEAESLHLMRQSQRLAEDVLSISAATWPQQPLFVSIRDSESSHADAIRVLLNRYNLFDPAPDGATGVFPSFALQAFYNRLAAASRVSQAEALRAAAEIQEREILDLTVQSRSIDNSDILRVYDSLLASSRNHLRSFVRALAQQGQAYVPQYLPPSEVSLIVNTPFETSR